MRIEWTAGAEEDCEIIFDRIRRDSFRAAIATDLKIEAQTERLIDHPHLGRPGRISGTRELIISRTPYIAAYTVNGNVIIILRVIHGAQEWPRKMSHEL